MERLPEGTIQEMVRRLAQALRPREIYLFGSQATGKTHRHSDVDFLVVVDDDAGDWAELERRGRDSLRDLRIPVDVLVYPRCEMDKWAPVRLSLPGTAVRKGRRLYAA